MSLRDERPLLVDLQRLRPPSPLARDLLRRRDGGPTLPGSTPGRYALGFSDRFRAWLDRVLHLHYRAYEGVEEELFATLLARSGSSPEGVDDGEEREHAATFEGSERRSREGASESPGAYPRSGAPPQARTYARDPERVDPSEERTGAPRKLHGARRVAEGVLKSPGAVGSDAETPGAASLSKPANFGGTATPRSPLRLPSATATGLHARSVRLDATFRGSRLSAIATLALNAYDPVAVDQERRAAATRRAPSDVSPSEVATDERDSKGSPSSTHDAPARSRRTSPIANVALARADAWNLPRPSSEGRTGRHDESGVIGGTDFSREPRAEAAYLRGDEDSQRETPGQAGFLAVRVASPWTELVLPTGKSAAATALISHLAAFAAREESRTIAPSADDPPAARRTPGDAQEVSRSGALPSPGSSSVVSADASRERGQPGDAALADRLEEREAARSGAPASNGRTGEPRRLFADDDSPDATGTGERTPFDLAAIAADATARSGSETSYKAAAAPGRLAQRTGRLPISFLTRGASARTRFSSPSKWPAFRAWRDVLDEALKRTWLRIADEE